MSKSISISKNKNELAKKAIFSKFKMLFALKLNFNGDHNLFKKYQI